MRTQNDSPAETHPPEDDGNFLHVVIYAGIFLVIGLIAAFIVVKVVGRHIVPGKHDPHPTSQLVLPRSNASATVAQSPDELPFIFSQQKLQTWV